MKEDKAFRNISARQKGKTLGGGLHISLYRYIYICLHVENGKNMDFGGPVHLAQQVCFNQT
jgi:hypothetical protein